MSSGNRLSPLSLKVLISVSLLPFNFTAVLSNPIEPLRYHSHKRCYKNKAVIYYITVRALIWSSLYSAANYLFPNINNKTTLRYSSFPVQPGVRVSKKAQLTAPLFYLHHTRWIFVVLWHWTDNKSSICSHPLYSIEGYLILLQGMSTTYCKVPKSQTKFLSVIKTQKMTFSVFILKRKGYLY